MKKKEIDFRGIQLKSITSVEDHEKLLGKFEELFYCEGRMDFSEFPKMKVEVQNLIIDAQKKLNNNYGINSPALLFFLGAYVSGLISTQINGIKGWMIGTLIAFSLMSIYVKVTHAIVSQYSEELLVYQNVDKLLDYIYRKNYKELSTDMR